MPVSYTHLDVYKRQIHTAWKLGVRRYVTEFWYQGEADSVSYTHLNQVWSDRSLQLFGLPKEKLCRLVPAGSVIGVTRPNITRLLGEEHPVQVLSAGGDQQCAALGQGAALSLIHIYSISQGRISWKNCSRADRTGPTCGRFL